MAAVHRKHEPSSAKATEGQGEKAEEKASEPVVVSDTVTETTERIEVVETASPDPLTEFKEKMTEEEKSPISDEPSKKNYMWPILFIFIIALLMLGGIFVYKQGIFKREKVDVATLSPTPTTIPTPTKTIDITKYEISILNGSEVDGEAGRQRSNLEKKGFTVSSIGNADNSDYTETIIQAKEDVGKDFIAKLKSILEQTFTVGETEVLSDDGPSSIVVILGTKK